MIPLLNGCLELFLTIQASFLSQPIISQIRRTRSRKLARPRLRLEDAMILFERCETILCFPLYSDLWKFLLKPRGLFHPRSDRFDKKLKNAKIQCVKISH